MKYLRVCTPSVLKEASFPDDESDWTEADRKWYEWLRDTAERHGVPIDVKSYPIS